MLRFSWFISASMVLIERAALSILASTSSSFPLVLAPNSKVDLASIAITANNSVLRFMFDSLASKLKVRRSLLVHDITDLARTVFNLFDARNLNRVSILLLKSACYLSFKIAGIDLSDLAASHDLRRRASTVKCATGSE